MVFEPGRAVGLGGCEGGPQRICLGGINFRDVDLGPQGLAQAGLYRQAPQRQRCCVLGAQAQAQCKQGGGHGRRTGVVLWCCHDGVLFLGNSGGPYCSLHLRTHFVTKP